MKAGDEYQELVAAVARALDPTAIVKSGQWVLGPDGRRDLDVEVRGLLEGRAHFALIECKDWGRPVGIGVVDALDSKRRDLGADSAMIFSNSGFTEPALAKAARVGVGMSSALKAGDSNVRVEIHRRIYEKRVAVEKVRVTVLYPPGAAQLPDDWSLKKLLFDGSPVHNWLADVSSALLKDCAADHTAGLVYECTFQPSTHEPFPRWTHDGVGFKIGGLVVSFPLSVFWFGQTVRVDVSLGAFDHLKGSVTIPSAQIYMLGDVDTGAWEPEPFAPGHEETLPDSFSIGFLALKPLGKFTDCATPNLDDVLWEHMANLLIGPVQHP